MARRCTWCEKKIRAHEVTRELALDRTERPKLRHFHQKCWREFVEYVFRV